MKLTRATLIRGLTVMGLLQAMRMETKAQGGGAATSTPPPTGATAQLVGCNVITNRFDQAYGIERYLPELLAFSPDRSAPKTFATISAGNGKFSPEGRARGDKYILYRLTGSLSFIVGHYNRTVEGFHMFMWKGVKMDGLLLVAGFEAGRTEEVARDIWSHAYNAYGLVSKPVLTLASGNSGWTTLEAALPLIASPDSKVIWQVTVDQPSYPEEDAANEAAVLLMLAHPAVDTGRKPLVYFSAPAVRAVKDAKPVDRDTRRVAALREAVQAACASCALDPATIGSVATDCGRNTPEAAQRLSSVSAALHGLVSADIDLVHERIDLPAVLGPLGANTVDYTLVLAAYAAYTRNHPVLYVSAVDPDAGRAMLILPPLGHVPPDPNRTFAKHRYTGQWYAPWWGQRLDGKLDY